MQTVRISRQLLLCTKQDEGTSTAIYRDAVRPQQRISTVQKDRKSSALKQLLCDSWILPVRPRWICAPVLYPRRRYYPYAHYLVCVHVCVFSVLADSGVSQVGFVCSLICPFFSTTIAGTCIMANLPRCRPSTMQNATPMNVKLCNGQHLVLFSATSCEPGKQSAK